MARQAHELVHHHADELGAVRHLDAQGFLNAQAQAVAVHVSRHVVHALAVEQALLVSEAFAHFLNATVNITRHNVDFFHELAVDRGAIAQHAVGRGVLGAYVDDILIGAEHFLLYTVHVALLVFDKAIGVVLVGLCTESYRIKFLVGVIVLAQGVSHPVGAQEETPHIGMIDKFDAEEVVHLTLLEIGDGPQVAHRVQARGLAVGGSHLHVKHVLRLGVGQVIHAAQRVLPVDAHHGVEIVEAQLLLQGLGQVVPFLVGHSHQQQLASGVKLSIGTELGNFFLYICHIK